MLLCSYIYTGLGREQVIYYTQSKRFGNTVLSLSATVNAAVQKRLRKTNKIIKLKKIILYLNF